MSFRVRLSFRLRPTLFKLHLYVSIAIALYVVIMAVTGAVMAFRPEISRLAHTDMAYVTQAPPLLSAEDLVSNVEMAHPDQPVIWFGLDEAPDGAAVVGVGIGAAGKVLSVNPYTGQILGDLSDDHVQGFLRAVTSIHQRLTPPTHFRRAAQLFMIWVTVAVLFLSVTGIYLWFPRMRFGIAGRGRPFWYDLHATLGIAAAIFIIVLTSSAIVMGFRPTFEPMIYALTGSKPTQQPKISPRPADGTQPIPIARAFEIGAEALAGAMPLQINTRPGVYDVWGRVPGDRLGSDVFVDRYTGAVVGVQLSRDAPAGQRLLALNRSIHGAEVFGMPGKIVLVLASLILAVQVVSVLRCGLSARPSGRWRQHLP